MARKPTSTSRSTRPAVKAPVKVAPPIKSTEIRNSPVPRAAAPAARREVSRELIASRAYEIWRSGQGGSDLDNWLRAERELRG